MATENITISKDYLLKAYRAAGPALKEFMKQLFGPDTFAISFNVMDRVKTFQDAVDELGSDSPLVRQYNQFYTEFGDLMDTDIIAYLKLRIITAALNEGWKPQFKEDEVRWFPYFILWSKDEIDNMSDEEKDDKQLLLWGGDANNGTDCGSSCSISNDGRADAHAIIGSRLALKTEALATYAGRQFASVYARFYIGDKASDAMPWRDIYFVKARKAASLKTQEGGAK